MDKHNVNKIKQALSVLVGQPLRLLDRVGSMLIVDFGELVEHEHPYCDSDGKFVRDEDGKLILKKSIKGIYGLNVMCSFRLVCGSELLLTNNDITIPSSKLEAEPDFNWGDFDWDAFEWSVRGNNRFDEMVAKYVGAEPFEFVVKKIAVGEFGDVTISFENGFDLELFVNCSGRDENWRFYREGDAASLVVLGDGIENEPELSLSHLHTTTKQDTMT